MDLFAGTSTGAIIAAYLASGRMKSFDEIVNLYRDEGPKIFQRNVKREILSIFGLYKSRYNADHLKSVLENLFGDMRLGDLQKRVLIPAVDLGGDKWPYQVKFFDNFKGNSTDLDIPVVDVLLASTAAPSYFGAHKITYKSFGTREYVDGGLACNHPSVSAICAALDVLGFDAEIQDVYCLHIATGFFPQSATGWNERGKFGWISDAIELATEQYSTTCYQSEKLLRQRFQCIGTSFGEKIDLDDPHGIAKIDRHWPNMSAMLTIANGYLARHW